MSASLDEKLIVLNLDLVAVKRSGWWSPHDLAIFVEDAIVTRTKELAAFGNPSDTTA